MAEQWRTWRVIDTDSESPSGVAPICPQQNTKGGMHDRRQWDKDFPTEFDDQGVYDCCPGPHLECWSVPYAAQVAALLTEAGAEVCT